MKKVLIFIFLIFICFSTNRVFAIDKIEINTASIKQLDELIGIGPVLGQRIIDARPFSSVDDLLRVKGIGEKTLQKIKEQGLAYVSASSLRGGSQADAAIPTSDKIASSPEAPRNDAPITYPGGIFINEILPSPEGADETEEWIELYNSNSFDVDLSGWKIEDIEGVKTSYIFSANTKITANGFLVLKRPETKISLNNTEDGLNLFWPDNKIENSMSYKNAPRFQSYNKINSSWNWSAILTPGSQNVIPLATKEQNKQESLSNLKNSDNNNLAAGLLNSGQENFNPWFLFFTALAITIVSAAAVLLIKFKLKNHVGT